MCKSKGACSLARSLACLWSLGTQIGAKQKGTKRNYRETVTEKSHAELSCRTDPGQPGAFKRCTDCLFGCLRSLVSLGAKFLQSVLAFSFIHHRQWQSWTRETGPPNPSQRSTRQRASCRKTWTKCQFQGDGRDACVGEEEGGRGQEWVRTAECPIHVYLHSSPTRQQQHVPCIPYSPRVHCTNTCSPVPSCL